MYNNIYIIYITYKRIKYKYISYNTVKNIKQNFSLTTRLLAKLRVACKKNGWLLFKKQKNEMKKGAPSLEQYI